MTGQRSNTANAWQTTLTSQMASTDLTATVSSTANGPASPGYFVIEPDKPSTQMEVVFFDGVFTATTFVASAIGKRYLTGSAAGSGLVHPVGSIVRSVPVSQLITDLFDYTDLVKAILTTAGDTPYATASGVWARLAIGTAGQVTVSNDGATAPIKVNTPPLLSRKQAVRVATTANGTDATAFANGQTVDGVVLATGDRILRKNQTTGSENGIFIVPASGAPVRATDFDTAAKVAASSDIEVSEGTVNAKTTWVLSNTGTVTPGSTAMTFKQKSSLVGVAQADLAYFDGTNWVILPKGTAGQVLTMNGGATAPSWASSGTSAMTLISSQVLGGTAASVTFSSIPATPYNQLLLVAVGRSNTASTGTFWKVTFNGDTAGNYDMLGEYVDWGAGPTRAQAGAQAAIGVAGNNDLAAANNTAGVAGRCELTIPAYAATTFWKECRLEAGMVDAANTVGDHQVQHGQWRSTAAITSVTLTPAAGSFIAGSAFYLYGIT